ncbi:MULTISPECIES: acyl-homoserine-lactone synthase [Pseudomonas]|uniref:Acyl-homoserine-lactone synthase n=4 Tax=Pseudomonas TaxID=286 RepID=A0A6S6G7G9_PSESJ|nr:MULTISPECIES: acyl-homoserine-lactone synthase [Pseudomonas]MCW6054621.1 acyl-homoserine-lactone synthase [Pseudomonas fragi]AZG85693.1 acyl-homoserine-lactone synthase [Pseudomonas syringae pv. pisi str. PP1]MBI6674576.1 acyl-homoserine-lactone synthase [Pseudomonas syringae]MBI6781776.1 acyl-homoserine-lactone synthase [Pseudomonas syringae]MBP1123273.1 acyl homoserine lactone synthase [Pseudomonas sp. PvP028]
MIIEVGTRTTLDKDCLMRMHKLRAQVFKDRKRWDVSIIADMEIDGYDALDPYYLILEDKDAPQQQFGCWRILPTTGPYMLKNTFPELLHGVDAPHSTHIWELSRFAILARDKQCHDLSRDSLLAIRAVIKFAIAHDVDEFVTVTTLGVEKLLRKKGLDISRFGPAIRIGVENAIALRIQLNRTTCESLGIPTGSDHQCLHRPNRYSLEHGDRATFNLL